MKTSLLATFALCTMLPAQEIVSTPVVASLTTIRGDADAFRNVSVVFEAQFASLGKLTNPFFTRFTPTEFTNLYVWADEQPIWQRESYENLFGNLFYSKQGGQLQEVFNLQMYQRLRIHGIVRNTFQGQPWIEVTRFDQLPGRVDAAVLSHLYRGEQFMNERRWSRAISELSKAPGAGVPEDVQRAAYRNLGICYLRIGEANQAIDSLRTAMALGGGDDLELQRLLSTAEDRPEAGIDRVVTQHGLKDYERPMWEAFEMSETGARAIR